MKKTLLIIIGAIIILGIGIVLILRFSTPEDSWVCEKGKWVKHGNPNMEMPKENCK
ncbi:MAG: hypothetical protein PHN19_01580 [Patescibacteria group bacterium]|nr:hypothetical protein [Patescibacteria group bacterium]